MKVDEEEQEQDEGRQGRQRRRGSSMWVSVSDTFGGCLQDYRWTTLHVEPAHVGVPLMRRRRRIDIFTRRALT
eukprot:9037866-Pyramimonas_sp.AAC.1